MPNIHSRNKTHVAQSLTIALLHLIIDFQNVKNQRHNFTQNLTKLGKVIVFLFGKKS